MTVVYSERKEDLGGLCKFLFLAILALKQRIKAIKGTLHKGHYDVLEK